MDTSENWLLWFINFLIKSQKEVILKMKLNKISNKLKNFINLLLEDLKNEECTRHLRTIFKVTI